MGNKGPHLLAVSELNELLKFWYFDFGMGFETVVDAVGLFLGREERLVPQAAVFGTRHRFSSSLRL